MIQGADGRVYMIQTDAQVLKQGQDGAFTPSTVTFSAYYRDGQTATRTAYAGRFVIQETTNGTSYTTKYTSNANESSHTYTPSSPNVKNIRCTLYAAGGTTSALDMQGVAIVRDVDNLTQEEVFNILTNNGAMQGIFMKDGNLYINASYIQSGTLTLGGNNNESGTLSLRNQNGLEIATFDNDGIHIKYGGSIKAGYSFQSGETYAVMDGQGIKLYKDSNRVLSVQVLPVSTGEVDASIRFNSDYADMFTFTDEKASGRGKQMLKYSNETFEIWADVNFYGNVNKGI